MSDDVAGYVDVALPVPLRRTFTYAVPRALAGQVKRGARVAVPFARRKAVGILGISERTLRYKLNQYRSEGYFSGSEDE